jgi:hypothetical protein
MRPINRLRPWQRVACDASGLLLLASGVAWLVVHYAWGAGSGDLPHPLEPWAMKLHGAGAMAALFVFGLLAGGHVPRGWHGTRHPGSRRQRHIGVALCVLAALGVASGYALYYFTPEPARFWVGNLHAAGGGAMALALLWHRRSPR